jgi:hypothetical protein
VNDRNELGSIEPDNPEAQAAAAALNAELAQRRTILNADQLCSLISPRARLERAFPALQAYFFTIDGVLNGSKVTGAMFAGECMLVLAFSERSAQEQANAGLRETVKLLEEEYRHRDILGTGATGAGLSVEGGGRKHDERPLFGKAAEQRAKLVRIMGDAMSKPSNWKR